MIIEPRMKMRTAFSASFGTRFGWQMGDFAAKLVRWTIYAAAALGLLILYAASQNPDQPETTAPMQLQGATTLRKATHEPIKHDAKIRE